MADPIPAIKSVLPRPAAKKLCLEHEKSTVHDKGNRFLERVNASALLER